MRALAGNVDIDASSATGQFKYEFGSHDQYMAACRDSRRRLPVLRQLSGGPQPAVEDEAKPVEPFKPFPVDVQSISAGVALARWFGNETRRVYGIFNEDDDARDRRQLLEMIERQGGSVTIREVTRASRTYASAARAELALSDLVKRGYEHLTADLD
ncbi:MAG: hypothetical protein KDA63_04840 [Planctomycetales bacterium]|nr:hypothetical protein [Planctomycetales bacterium]